MQQQIIFLAQEGGPGGLFDIGATLPLVAIQFLVLMFLLNTLLYSPLINEVNDRNGYILNNLSRTSELLLEANQLTRDYQNNLEITSQDAQRELLQIQKLQQETLNAEVKFIQSKINNEQVKARETRAWKKKLILRQVKPEIDTLTNAIMTKLSM